jgi:diaminohydroxyphosphoribosylaminopyrimidine deaminase/5-amino-6-(5-phosphoribosylamino)uracil reductase
LIAARVGSVIAAVDDPHQEDPWSWFEKAGIAYTVGFWRREAEHLHGGFLTRLRQGRPRFTGKWAITMDGALATVSGDARWISSPEALALSRRRRRAFDAILIGSGTARRDDPRLAAIGARWHGTDCGPIRIVVGRDPELSFGSQLLRTAQAQPLLLVCATPSVDQVEALSAVGATTLSLSDPHDVEQLALGLGDLGLNEVLVEGGATVHGAYLRAGLYDRLEIYMGASTLGGGLPPAVGQGVGTLAEAQRWELEEPPRVLGDTVLLRWRRKPL